MANIKSSKKSVRTDKIKTASNTSYTSKVKNGMKKLEKAIKDKNTEVATSVLKNTMADLDKCSSKGLIKKNTCNREKARLNKKVKEMN
jgi:small subunit ribosomal protein S20